MKVNVSFTLDINITEWVYRNGGRVVDMSGSLEKISDEVRAHAENVVRDLFADMGWTIEEVNA